MSGIKYYQLGENEELPDEFCAVRDVNGEPEEYTWYEPMDSFDREFWGLFKENDWVLASEYRKLVAENAKLRERLSQRTAKRIVVSNHNTDCATGHTECSECGGAIDFFDNYCRHCGARLEDE